MSNAIAWREIERLLDGLQKVDGGFTVAWRGLLALPSGQEVFVKAGVDDQTKAWAKREVAAYRFLARLKYPFAPKLLSVNSDETAFATEALTGEHGWDWSDIWTEERLSKTLEAMDALAALPVSGSDKTYFSEEIISEHNNGWRPLVGSIERQNTLLAGLRTRGVADLAASLNFETMAAKSASFLFVGDTLVHNDLRADNCAWHAGQQMVKLVDWNQLQLGDRRIDLAATLVHVQRSGLDVIGLCGSRLDPDALHWLAGFFFDHATRPIWSGGPKRLRAVQMESAIVAYDLWQKVR